MLWFGRAMPRVWLSDGERLHVNDTATAYGRVSMQLASAIDQNSSIHARLTLPWTNNSRRIPQGGIRLRLRCPGGRILSKVVIGGKPWTRFNASDESISVSKQDLVAPGMLAGLRDIVATWK